MTSDLHGDDPKYDLGSDEKDSLEAELRKKARDLLRNGKSKERQRILARAVEVSRRKARRSHEGRD
jgi:hypothetical protein